MIFFGGSQARCMPGMEPRLTAPATNASAPPGIATLPASSPDAGDGAEAYRSGDECLRQLSFLLALPQPHCAEGIRAEDA